MTSVIDPLGKDDEKLVGIQPKLPDIVPVRKVRKKPTLTDEQRAARRERMLKLNADRKQMTDSVRKKEELKKIKRGDFLKKAKNYFNKVYTDGDESYFDLFKKPNLEAPKSSESVVQDDTPAADQTPMDKGKENAKEVENAQILEVIEEKTSKSGNLPAEAILPSQEMKADAKEDGTKDDLLRTLSMEIERLNKEVQMFQQAKVPISNAQGIVFL